MTIITDPNLISQLEQGAPKPVTDPALIAQLEGNSQDSGGLMGDARNFLDSLGSGSRDADVLSGIAKAGMGLANTPKNIANLFSPQLAAKIPGSPITGQDIDNVLGTQNAGIGGTILKNIGQYAPYLAGGEIAGLGKAAEGAPFLARMLTRATGDAQVGGAYGATQSQDPLKGALTGGLLNAALGAGNELASPLANALKGYFSKYAAQGLTKQAGNMLNDPAGVPNEDAFNLAKQNYINMSGNEKNAWDNLSGAAAQADASGAPFNNQPYIDSLQTQLEKLQGQSSRQSGYARANKDSQTLLSNYADDQHGTFADAIEHNKALNQDYQNEITPGKSLPFSTVNYAKSNIKNAINQNIQDNGLQDTLGSAWNNANQITSQKNQIFNQIVNPKGKEQISTFSSMINGKNPTQDPTSFVNDYLPTAKGDGTQKMQQFAQMVGDENTAKSVLKQNYFDKAIESGVVNPRQFLSKYNNLSDDQQNYLFSPQENQTVQALNKINQAHPDALSSSMMGSLGHHSIAATLGGIIGVFTGHGLWEGLGAGILGGAVANAGLRKSFENPAISNYFVKYLMNKAPQTSGNFSSRLSPLITPALVNSLGGQQ